MTQGDRAEDTVSLGPEAGLGQVLLQHAHSGALHTDVERLLAALGRGKRWGDWNSSERQRRHEHD